MYMLHSASDNFFFFVFLHKQVGINQQNHLSEVVLLVDTNLSYMENVCKFWQNRLFIRSLSNAIVYLMSGKCAIPPGI